MKNCGTNVPNFPENKSTNVKPSDTKLHFLYAK